MAFILSENYKITTDQIINKGILSSDDIYLFDTNPKQTLYQEYFRWSVSIILSERISQIVSDPFIVFIDDFSINAFASKHELFKLIGLNYDLIEIMYDFLEKSNDIFNQDKNSKYKLTTTKIKGQPPFFVLFKYLTKFIFLHELGHLLQTTGSKSYYDEKFYNDLTSDVSYDSQIKEFDADAFGCVFICAEVASDFSYLLREDRSEQDLLNLSILALTAMFVFFAKSSENYDGVYYLGKSHPHPLIRLGYLSTIFTYNINTQNPGYKLTVESIYEGSLNLLTSILNLSLESFRSKIITDYEKINEHINLLEKSYQIPGLAITNYFKSFN